MNNTHHENNTCHKIDLYILSLGLLFISFVIIKIKPPDTSFMIGDVTAWKKLIIEENLISTISIGFLVYCAYAYKKFDFVLKGTRQIPFEIKEIESINYEHLTFLATYIMPLAGFNLDNIREIVVLALLLIVIGIIYIKTDLFYANPSLALLGYNIYRADGKFKPRIGDRPGIILIAREKLSKGQKVAYIRLDDRIYYVKVKGA